MKKKFFARLLALGAFRGKNVFFSLDDPEKKFLLYIGKWINGKFWISGFSDEILKFFTP